MDIAPRKKLERVLSDPAELAPEYRLALSFERMPQWRINGNASLLWLSWIDLIFVCPGPSFTIDTSIMQLEYLASLCRGPPPLYLLSWSLPFTQSTNWGEFALESWATHLPFHLGRQIFLRTIVLHTLHGFFTFLDLPSQIQEGTRNTSNT